jgi:solute carrier family 50 protein (sugar transporter)
VGFGAGGGGGIAFGVRKDLAKEIVGYIAMVVNLIMYGAPLTLITKMVREGDVSSLSPVTMLAGLCTSSMWLAFALMIKNIFIGIPNGIGILIFLVQFAIYAKFKDSDATQRSRAAMAADSEKDQLVN